MLVVLALLLVIGWVAWLDYRKPGTSPIINVYISDGKKEAKAVDNIELNEPLKKEIDIAKFVNNTSKTGDIKQWLDKKPDNQNLL